MTPDTTGKGDVVRAMVASVTLDKRKLGCVTRAMALYVLACEHLIVMPLGPGRSIAKISTFLIGDDCDPVGAGMHQSGWFRDILLTNAIKGRMAPDIDQALALCNSLEPELLALARADL